jgi:TorA maturation chaperone TorD
MTVLAQFQHAVAADLLQLAVLHDRELDADTLAQLRAVGFPDNLAFRLESAMAGDARAWLKQALAQLSGPPSAAQLDELAADYAAIYLNHTVRASPYESVWIDEDGLAMQEPMFQIRAWYQRFGVEVADWRQRSDDHLVHQLEFVAHLLAQTHETEAVAEAARFLDEHLLRWVGDFARRVATRAATPYYAGLGALTAAYLEELRDVLAEALAQPRPSKEDIDRRMKPKHEAVIAMPEPYVPGASPSW